MQSSSLLPSTASLSIKEINLSTRAYNSLHRAGIRTVGQLADLTREDLLKIPSMGRKGVDGITSVCTALRDNESYEGIDWLAFCEQLRLTVIPDLADEPLGMSYVIENLIPIIKSIVVTNDGDQLWKVIQRRYGLERTTPLTLAQLGAAFSLTRERVRQLESETLADIRSVLFERNYVGKKYRIHPMFSLAVGKFVALLHTIATHGILNADLISTIQDECDDAISLSEMELAFVLDLFGLAQAEFSNQRLGKLWFSGSPAHIKKVVTLAERLHTVLTEELVRPVDELDLLAALNSVAKTSDEAADISDLHVAMRVCPSAEVLSDGRVQAKYEFVRNRCDQAERILLDQGVPIHIRELCREINHRAVLGRAKKVNEANLRNQLTCDSRFFAQGKSGFWALCEWPHESRPIKQLMIECLEKANRTLTPREILNYVADLRPVSESSIGIYLTGESEFGKAGKNQWGLASWKEVRNKEKEPGSGSKKRTLKRKNQTLRERMAEYVERLLRDTPGMELSLKELADKLAKKFDSSYHTCHSYLSAMENLDKVRIGNDRKVAFRLRLSNHRFPFEAVDGIETGELRDKVLRTFRFFNEEDIDVALFMLSKEFESTLEGYYVVAMEKGLVEPMKEKRLSLDLMINQIAKTGIVTDKAVLNYLRQSRNDRAHGTMPSVEERRMMMNNAHTIAGLYVDYIKFFDGKRRELSSTTEC